MGKPVVGLGAAPVLFGTVCAAVLSTIVYVHYNQRSEKEVCLNSIFMLSTKNVTTERVHVDGTDR